MWCPGWRPEQGCFCSLPVSCSEAELGGTGQGVVYGVAGGHHLQVKQLSHVSLAQRAVLESFCLIWSPCVPMSLHSGHIGPLLPGSAWAQGCVCHVPLGNTDLRGHPESRASSVLSSQPGAMGRAGGLAVPQQPPTLSSSPVSRGSREADSRGCEGVWKPSAAGQLWGHIWSIGTLIPMPCCPR